MDRSFLCFFSLSGFYILQDHEQEQAQGPALHCRCLCREGAEDQGRERRNRNRMLNPAASRRPVGW